MSAGAAPFDCTKCGGADLQVIGLSRALVMYLQCDGCGHVSAAEHSDREAVSDLANALQSAVLLSEDVAAAVRASKPVSDVGRLQHSLQQAVAALQRLRRH
jgi:hypothetical protein